MLLLFVKEPQIISYAMYIT